MKSPGDCAHEACGCKARGASNYCSNACEAGAERASASASAACNCKHDGCAAKGESADQSIDGNQGEGNREADRRYREGATEFARSGKASEAARDAAVDLDALEREGRKMREKL
jgi:hypothetical protein